MPVASAFTALFAVVFVALVAVLLLSAGWSALVNVLNVLMQPAFGGTQTFAMNLGNFFFGLGAFLTPLIIAYLLYRAGYSRALLALGGLALATGLLAMGVDFEALTPRGVEGANPGVGALLRDPIMWLTALALLFYAPMEATMAAWATTYLGEKGMSEGRAATVLSGFWLAFMCSRLATAIGVATFPLPSGGDTTLIIALSILCVLVWTGAVLSPGRGMAAVMVILAGLVFGPTFPTIIGVLMGHVNESISPVLGGRAVGLFFAIGGIGWSVIPILIGAYARKTSVQRSFLIAVVAAVGLTVAALALHFIPGSAGGSNQAATPAQFELLAATERQSGDKSPHSKDLEVHPTGATRQTPGTTDCEWSSAYARPCVPPRSTAAQSPHWYSSAIAAPPRSVTDRRPAYPANEQADR